MRVQKKKETERKKRAGKKLAAAAAAAVVLTAGAAVHERFSAEELIARPIRQPAAAMERTEAAEEDVLGTLPEEERSLSRADGVRRWFLRLPAWARTAFLLPLWAVGCLPAALAPALGLVWDALLGFAVQAAVLLGLFTLVYKLLFPEHRVRELFRRKNLRWLFLGALTLTAANVALTHLWTDWSAVRTVLMLAAGFGVLCLLWKRLCGAFRAPEPEKVKTRLVVDTAA